MQKISKYKTASTYARAWFYAAKENKQEDLVFKEIQLLRESMRQEAGLWHMLSQPTDGNEDKIEIISDLARKAQFSEISFETLKMIAENNRLGLLRFICSAFIKNYYKDKGIIEVTVDTAVELTKTQNQTLKKTLEDKLKTSVVIEYRIKPEVLGGLAIRFNSLLIDDTLSGKLKHLKQRMLNSKPE